MTTLLPSFLNGSSSFLQVIRTTIKAWISLLFYQIQRLTTELAALECLKKIASTIDLTLLKLADHKGGNV